MIATSPIKISCVIAAGSVPEAVRGAASGVRARRRRRARGRADRNRAPAQGHPVTPPDGYRVGVLGATGAVGSTILEILAERGFPAREVVPFASERSAGRKVEFAGDEIECQVLAPETIAGLDLVLSSAGGSVSSEWAPKLVEAGAVVVDNTSFWRMHDDVPLVIPEVNPDAVEGHRGHRRQPELHDDADGRRAGADRARRRDRAARRLHLPVGLRHRAQRDRGAAYAGAGDARRRRAGRRGLSRTRSPSTSCPRSRPSRKATTTPPRSAR